MFLYVKIERKNASFLLKYLVGSEKVSTFALAFEESTSDKAYKERVL